MSRRNYRRHHLILQRAGFNPHLPASFVLGDYQQYRVRRTQVHHYRTITLRRVVRRATLDRRGRVGRSYSYRIRDLVWEDEEKRTRR